ncbi:MAG: restriction endonuclease subunit S [Sedimentisphaerales bacterium]|nr:restriction endonuclease subunit S [Sedimentisphaerales bacterium]
MTAKVFSACTLDDLANFRNGKGLSNEEYTPYGKFPVFGANGQIARTDRLLNPEPVVVIGRVGAYCGSVHRISEPSWVSDNAIVVTPKKGMDLGFLYYRLVSLDLRRTAIGSAQPLMTQGGLKVINTIVPSLPEQRAIAHILGNLDDKIELNRRMNETLEAMARAIFKSWFVDFDPVRVKAEGKKPSGMNADTAKLFPDSFEDSPLGKIPKGWKVKSLPEIANYLNGLALQKYPPDNNGDALPVIKIAQLRAGKADGNGFASTSIPAEYIVDDGDILFSWSGSLMVTIWCGGRGALNQHLFKVTSESYPKWFYYFWTLHHLTDFQFIAAGKATTMGHIQRHHLEEAKTLVPPDKLLEKMDTTFSPLLEKVVLNNIQTKILSSLRDTLLPKLLSGEIRVKI